MSSEKPKHTPLLSVNVLTVPPTKLENGMLDAPPRRYVQISTRIGTIGIPEYVAVIGGIVGLGALVFGIISWLS